MKKNTTLALAISAALLVPSAASAAIALSEAGTATPLKFAKEVPVSGTGTSFAINGTAEDLTMPTPVGIQITGSNPAFVKVNILNGAKFLKAPKILCKYTAGAANSGSLTVGGAGAAAVTFQLANGVLNGSGCTVEAYSGLTVSGKHDQNVSAKLEFLDAGVAASKGYKGQLVTFNRALGSIFGIPNQDIKIDVSKSSREFVSAGQTKAKTAYLGRVEFDKLAGASGINTAGVQLAVNTTTFSAAIVKIAGTTVASVGTASGNKFLLTHTAAGTCNAAAVASGKVSGSTVTFQSINGVQATAGVNVCLTVNGTTALEKGQITASINAIAKNNFTLDTAIDNPNLALIDKNGSGAKVLIVPKTTAADGLFVRIYNISNVTGKVLGTLYSQGSTDGNNTDAGKVLGTGTLVASLAPNAVTILKQSDIATALGITDAWPGRAWLQVDAEFEGLRVMSLIRSPSGVLTNFSDSACTTPTLCGD